MKKIFVTIAILIALCLSGWTMVGAQDVPSPSCSLSVPSTELVNTNHVEVTVSAVGGDWVTVALNNTDTGDVPNGATSGFDMPFPVGPHQTISGHVTGTSVSCGEPLEIHITDWDLVPSPEPGDGGISSFPPVGNLAFMGHGIDDCRFFLNAGAVYAADNNTLNVMVQKMGESARPFTVSVASLDGRVQWFAPSSDPDLSGENGIGYASYSLPYDAVLSDTTVTQVYVKVSNATTGVTCYGPTPVSIR